MSLVMVAICTTPQVGVAQLEVAASSQEYPGPQCTKPGVKLIKPESDRTGTVSNLGAVGSYNSSVKTYNREARAFNSCMHSYIDSANGELKRVQSDANDKIKQITDSANARLRDIEAKIANAIKNANEVADEEAATRK